LARRLRPRNLILGGGSEGAVEAPSDYFEVFGLPRRLVVDAEELQRRFYELSRRHHPDFHQGAEADVQARALETSALVNAAYRTLRDPIARVEYLVKLEAGPAGSADAVPPALLAEMFETMEALAEARRAGVDGAVREKLRAERDRLVERQASEERWLSETLARDWDEAAERDRRGILAAARRALATRKYLGTVIDDLSAALGEREESSVSNRRH
jgi:molecular chaperone HscB